MLHANNTHYNRTLHNVTYHDTGITYCMLQYVMISNNIACYDMLYCNPSTSVII